MDIKEIALKVGLQAFEEHPYDEGHVVSPSGYTWIDDKLIEFAEALISAYKAELLKEVGESTCRVSTTGIITNQTNAPLEPGLELYTADQLIAARKGLEDQLAKAEQQVAEWQSIETAPKDGTKLLLVKAGWEATTGFFHPVFEKWATVSSDHFGDESEWREWFEENSYSPTHWMPLPKAPNGASS